MGSFREDFEVKAKSHKKEAFSSWMDQPMTRALISLVPPMENKEMLQALLEAAFEYGFNSGQGMILSEIAADMLKRDSRRG